MYCQNTWLQPQGLRNLTGSALPQRGNLCRQGKVYKFTNSCKLQSRKLIRAQSATSLTSIEVSQDLDTITKYFRTWMRKADIDTGKVDVVAENGRVQLISNQVIQQNETIFKVPESVWITPAVVAESPIGKYVEGQELWIQLVILLLYDRAVGSGAYKQYSELIVKKTESPFFWTDEQVAYLEGTQIYDRLKGYQAFFEEKYKLIRETVFKRAPDVFPTSVFTYDAFVKMIASLRAHVHPPLEKQQIALVPVADLVKHSRKPNVTWEIETSGLFRKEKVVAVRASRFIRAGQPLSMNFNEAGTDADVLLDFGQIDLDQAVLGFVFTLSLDEDMDFYYDKVDVLEVNKRPESQPFRLEEGEPPPEDMVATLRLMMLGGPDAFLLEPLFRNELWMHLLLPVSQLNEGNMCDAMLEGIEAQLAKYTSTADEDSKVLSRLDSDTRPFLAVLIRQAEKRALESVASWFKSQKQSMWQLEYYQERRLKRLGLIDERGRSTYDTLGRPDVDGYGPKNSLL